MSIKKSLLTLSFSFILLSSSCLACDKQENFENWKDNSTPINALTEYVEKVSNKHSEQFIPQ